MVRAICVGLSASILLLSSTAQASPRGDLKKQARETIEQLESKGWPQSRCSIGAAVDRNLIVEGQGDLKPGDEILFLGDKATEEMSTEEFVDLLSGIAPNATITLQLKRADEVMNVEVGCSDSAPMQTAVLDALNQARRGKFDDCHDTLKPLAGNQGFVDNLLWQCAVVSKNSEKYALSDLTYNRLKTQNDFAHWRPEKRTEYLTALRSGKALLTTAKFESLVEATREWPGGETMFDDTQPDWWTFRTNAERALLAGFFDPASAQIDWPYGFTLGSWKPVFQGRINGYWTCGRVNGKNRFGGFVGARYFVVVLDANANVLFHQVGDGGAYDLVAGSCQNSIAMLPPAPAEFFEDPASESAATTAAASAPPSMAEELELLAQLYESGALTKEEYDTAKAKVLAR